MLLLLNVAIWGSAVYSIKIAISGRPILSLIVSSPRQVVEQAAVALDAEAPDREWGEDVSSFLSKLAKLSLFSTVMLAVEYMLCFYFIKLSLADTIAWFLIIKNIIFLILSIYFQKRTTESNPIHALLAVPDWAIRWERIACFCSAICLVIQLLRLNKIIEA